MTDCLIIGYNDQNFEDYVKMVKSHGVDSGAYRDLTMNFIEYKGKPYRAMDIMDHLYCENKPGDQRRFSCQDLLFPVIMYLGTYLHKRGFTFDYINSFQTEKEDLKTKLEKNDIKTIAITTTLYVSFDPIVEIVSFIRKYNDSAKIIVGGPYIFNQWLMLKKDEMKSIYEYIDADFYIIGSEGETALVQLLRALDKNLPLDGIKNLAYKDKGAFVTTETESETNLLEDNMIDYSLFPKEDLKEMLSLRTSKSCPFLCAYCGYRIRAGKYRFLSPEFVEKEFDAIKNIGTVNALTFLDDTFNVPAKRFKAVLEMMIQKR